MKTMPIYAVLMRHDDAFSVLLPPTLRVVETAEGEGPQAEPRACQHCGKLYRPKQRRQRYCSPCCQVNAYRLKRAAEAASSGTAGAEAQ